MRHELDCRELSFCDGPFTQVRDDSRKFYFDRADVIRQAKERFKAFHEANPLVERTENTFRDQRTLLRGGYYHSGTDGSLPHSLFDHSYRWRWRIKGVKRAFFSIAFPYHGVSTGDVEELIEGLSFVNLGPDYSWYWRGDRTEMVVVGTPDMLSRLTLDYLGDSCAPPTIREGGETYY